MRNANVLIQDLLAGKLWEDEYGYHFKYDSTYLEQENAVAISLTLPLQTQKYTSDSLFAFFDGLIPEGWLLNVVEKNWKINPRDRFGILLATGKDCIGNISIIGNE